MVRHTLYNQPKGLRKNFLFGARLCGAWESCLALKSGMMGLQKDQLIRKTCASELGQICDFQRLTITARLSMTVATV